MRLHEMNALATQRKRHGYGMRQHRGVSVLLMFNGSPHLSSVEYGGFYYTVYVGRYEQKTVRRSDMPPLSIYGSHQWRW